MDHPDRPAASLDSSSAQPVSLDDLQKAFDFLLEPSTHHPPSHDSFLRSLPFSTGDVTAGSENEYQTAVIGSKETIDLAITFENSNFFKNIVKVGTLERHPERLAHELQQFLNHTHNSIWENSWVRFPRRFLSHFADQVLSHDLLSDKKNSSGPQRSDLHNFIFQQQGEDWLRVPISYLLRLALADSIGEKPKAPYIIRKVGERLMNHFLNDNTSPETFSFYIVKMNPESHMGREVGREAAKRFLLSHLLTAYANHKFKLGDTGQQAVVYFAPHPPIRQKKLNRLISDSFYRELFMNPCLSGWNSGEEKHQYMTLCHQVLSRSHLNAVGRLKDAGIITRNLVTLPSPSNISLANNGSHLSLGSRKLTAILKNNSEAFTPACEKYIGDLVIKIVEHFLPLFVGTYSAAPYRLDFWDFHPEQALGFLPHELNDTYLKLLWQRWKRKAGLKIVGKPFTPIGPLWLDKLISRTFRLKGDFIPDFRLIDYLAVLPSTEQSPALDGTLGNDDRLKKDLAELGIYDEKMSLYLLYKLRTCSTMGFSGFEGRYYSLFESLSDDFADAASLQTLITALAFKYIFGFQVTHAHIPDTPIVESERRQIFFGAALNLPTFYVHAESQNMFLRKILAKMRKIRMSHRFPHFIRAHFKEYRRALLTILQEDAADLIEAFGLEECIERMKSKLENPSECSAFGKLTRGILEESGSSSPLQLDGEECNTAAESYYRNTLRKKHLKEGITFLKEDFQDTSERALNKDKDMSLVFKNLLGKNIHPLSFLERIEPDILDDRANLSGIGKLIRLVLLSLYPDMEQSEHSEKEAPLDETPCSSIY